MKFLSLSFCHKPTVTTQISKAYLGCAFSVILQILNLSQWKRREEKADWEALVEETPPAYAAKAANGKRVHQAARVLLAVELHVLSITCRPQGSLRYPVSTGRLQSSFILGLDTTATVGQLFFIKKKEVAQHPFRSTLSMTSSFIPSSCLLLCSFPEAWTLLWKWGTRVAGFLPQIKCKTCVRPSATHFSPAPQMPSTETRDTRTHSDTPLLTEITWNLSWMRFLGRNAYRASSICNFAHFQQGGFQSPSSLGGSSLPQSWGDVLKSPKLWPYTRCQGYGLHWVRLKTKCSQRR